MKKKILVTCIAMILVSIIMQAQAIYLPTSNEVYDFLKRMDAKGYLSNYQDAAKPLSRMYLAKQLKELETFHEVMTSLERATYEFYKTEFNYELLSLAGDPEPSETRWHLFSKEIDQGIINLDIGYALTAENDGGLKEYKITPTDPVSRAPGLQPAPAFTEGSAGGEFSAEYFSSR